VKNKLFEEECVMEGKLYSKGLELKIKKEFIWETKHILRALKE
jgi:hypothetical protein